MTDTDHEKYEDLVGLYVLNAIDHVERNMIEVHLASCEVCSSDVAALRETLVELAPHADFGDLDSLWDKITNELDEPKPREVSNVRQFPTRTRQFRIGGPSSIAAAVILVAAFGSLGAGITALEYHNGVMTSNTKLQSQIIQNTAKAPDHRYVTLASTNRQYYLKLLISGTGAAYVSSSQLPQLTKSKTFQLWGIGNSGATSISLIGTNSKSSSISIPVNSNFKELAMTLEPAGGSIAPTSTPIVFAPY